MHINCDEEPQRPFWQALLLVCSPVAIVALIEQIGGIYRARFETPKPPTTEKKTP